MKDFDKREMTAEEREEYRRDLHTYVINPALAEIKEEEFDEDKEYVSLRMQLKQKIDISQKMEQEFRALYHAEIDRKMDHMIQTKA